MDINKYLTSDDIIHQLRLFYGYPMCNEIDFTKYLGGIESTNDGYLQIIVRGQTFIIDPVIGVIKEYYEGGRA